MNLTPHASRLAPDLQRDFTALAELFQSGRITAVTDTELQIMAAPVQNVRQLIALGWLEEKPMGRWSKVLVPAGELAAKLGREPSVESREPEPSEPSSFVPRPSTHQHAA